MRQLHVSFLSSSLHQYHKSTHYNKTHLLLGVVQFLASFDCFCFVCLQVCITYDTLFCSFLFFLFCPVLGFVVLQCSHQKVQVHVLFLSALHQEHKSCFQHYQQTLIFKCPFIFQQHQVHVQTQVGGGMLDAFPRTIGIGLLWRATMVTLQWDGMVSRWGGV